MKRTLEIDLHKAREWYTSSNKVLKELALQVFSEEELIFSYEKIIEEEQLTKLLYLLFTKKKQKF